MKTYAAIGLAVGLLGTAAFAEQAGRSSRHPAAASMSMNAAETPAELKLSMRKLWEDHITYTRNYIISALAKLPDADTVLTRLLKNQDDLGAAIKPYYGRQAGNKLAALLRDHITIAGDVVGAAMKGDKHRLEAAQHKWSANGRDIARFLSDANPNWDRAQMQAMLQKHLDLTTGEVVARLKKDWQADVKSYDEGHRHMLMFADMLSDGIAQQYPEKLQGATVAQRRR